MYFHRLFLLCFFLSLPFLLSTPSLSSTANIHVAISIDESNESTDHRPNHSDPSPSPASSLSSLSSASALFTVPDVSPVHVTSPAPFAPTIAPSNSAPVECFLEVAATLSYYVNTDGTFATKWISQWNSLFSTRPYSYADGMGKVNAYIAGYSPDVDGIIIAFRGTQGIRPEWETKRELALAVFDWFQDFAFLPIDQQNWQFNEKLTYDGRAADIEKDKKVHLVPGAMVHTGIWEAMNTLYHDVVSTIQRLQKEHPGAKLYFTGHSKGGGMTLLAAYRIMVEHQIYPTGVYTFAAPRVGNSVFANTFPYDKTTVWRFEGQGDIVPLIPPNFKEDGGIVRVFSWIMKYLLGNANYADHGDYSPVGELHFVGANGVVTIGRDPNPKQTESIFIKALQNGVKGIGGLLKNHGMGCTGAEKYYEGACKTQCAVNESP